MCKETHRLFLFLLGLPVSTACTESEPEEMDQKANKTEPLGHACFFPLLPAVCGQISAMRPNWGRAAVHDS